MANPGVLFVTMQPKPGLQIEQFHEWYNNEHGPTRLRLPRLFTSGLRYRAADGEAPEFLAIYDVTSMPLLETEVYSVLRANRSPREAEVIGWVDVKRYFWELVCTEQSSFFFPIEQLSDSETEGIVLLTVRLRLKDDAEPKAEDEITRWFEGQIDMLSRVTGWLRSRVFRTSHLETGVPTSVIALHEFAKENELGDLASHAATRSPTWDDVAAKHATLASQRQYSLFYVFGPAPRDLHNLSRLEPAKAAFTSADAKTRTANEPPSPAIESYVTLPDGLVIPYRLEGNPDPRAPTVALSNSLLTSLHMWDPFVATLLEKRPRYRILRYDTRGRHALAPAPEAPATLAGLSDDLGALLAALRIPKLAALVGVSMGGATTVRFALDHPDRVARFVACDFNAASGAANTDAWRARIALAQEPAADGGGPAGIERLAAETVGRWFDPATAPRRPDAAREMAAMLAANDVAGFRWSCQALWDYDLRPELGGCRVPGLLVAGAGDRDGKMAEAMEAFRPLLGKGGRAKLAVVPDAGHLPMFEHPEGFWEAVEKFL
ncbi:alpha/beta-hydrolase [Durotheca rogersii]|uniref:alpha/beta-hydrolase n=1 Tax=Durotheca rogersii TaxID=419775 RepID=UPI00221F5180|nr:alpha/beta-hydrolase [Durotheca rogersii]KAI5860373.1 alpha/beta-hydrolase [Durotheca rogersii]